MKKIKIHIAEDHDVFKDGILALLNASNLYFELVGYTRTPSETISFVAKNHVDVLILDISLKQENLMMDCDGYDVLRFIQESKLKTRSIICSAHDEDRYVMEAYKLGASGFIFKRDHQYKIEDAIREVYRGGSFYSENVNKSAILEAEEEMVLMAGLTEKEKQILAKLSEKESLVLTREKLNISESTLRVHKLNIRRKLNLKSNAGLAKFALLMQKVRFK